MSDFDDSLKPVSYTHLDVYKRQSMFTAFSDGKVSAIISFLRTFAFLVVCILLLPKVLGDNGVWLAVPVAECLTVFISVGFFWKKKNVYHYMGK